MLRIAWIEVNYVTVVDWESNNHTLYVWLSIGL